VSFFFGDFYLFLGLFFISPYFGFFFGFLSFDLLFDLFLFFLSFDFFIFSKPKLYKILFL